MGFLNNILGVGQVVGSIGQAVKTTSEVFHVNETEEMRLNAQRFGATNAQFAQEFTNGPKSLFGHFVNALNRLPRPLLAFGTIGLFVYAMADPAGFTLRMQGLNYVPEPLWWLLGAIVGFYFGARELHHFRNPDYTSIVGGSDRTLNEQVTTNNGEVKDQIAPKGFAKTKMPDIKSDNPAIQAWLAKVS